MAYRPDDPYNIGIGTPYLGNINTGQVPVNNIELAKTFNTRQGLLDIGAAEKGKVYGYNPTVVGDFIGKSKKLQGSQNPVTGGGDIGSIKTWMTDPKRQHIYEDYLDKSGTQFIPEIQKALEQGLFENRDDFGNQLLYEEAIKNKGDQAFLDDEYDFSGIAGQTAGLNIPLMIKAYLKNRAKYAVASTAANYALEAKAKAAEKKAAADARKKQRMSDKQYDDWRRHNDAGYNKTADEKLAMTGGTEEWGEDMMGGTDPAPGNGNVSAGTGTDFGPMSHMIARGGLAQHAPRYANGGLIDFFRYGGFIG